MFRHCCRILRLITLLITLTLVGCAYTTEGTKLSPITTTTPSFKTNIEHTVGDFSFTLEGGKMITSNKAGELLSNQIVDKWQDREYISDSEYVDSGSFSGNSDYDLTLSGSQYGESSIGMQILSGLTFFLIPYTVTQHYDIHYSLNDNKSRKKYEASLQESNKIYIELFLLFALPFSGNGQENMMERIGDHLYEQFYKQGAFQQPSPIGTP